MGDACSSVLSVPNPKWQGRRRMTCKEAAGQMSSKIVTIRHWTVFIGKLAKETKLETSHRKPAAQWFVSTLVGLITAVFHRLF